MEAADQPEPVTPANAHGIAQERREIEAVVEVHGPDGAREVSRQNANDPARDPVDLHLTSEHARVAAEQGREAAHDLLRRNAADRHASVPHDRVSDRSGPRPRSCRADRVQQRTASFEDDAAEDVRLPMAGSDPHGLDFNRNYPYRWLPENDQMGAGLDVITDGEQTRLDFNLSFYGYLEGIALESAPPRRFEPPPTWAPGRSTPGKAVP